jgi:hypothetical protein
MTLQKKNKKQLALIADELSNRLTILVAVRRFPCMAVADSRSLRSECSYIRMQYFVRRITSLAFRRFRGMCDVNSCNVFMMLFTVL